MTDRAYLRFPHIHSDMLTFVASDAVWLAPAQGGRAWCLAAEDAPPGNPRLSPDGAHVAWTSRRFGHPEVSAARVDGGPVRRLTYWGNPHTKVVGWTPDGRVLATSPAGEATLRDHWLRAVSLDGEVERLPYGPASALAWGPDGALVLCSAWAREPAYWKRYRGGTAPQLWLDRDGSGTWNRLLPELTSGLAWPMWIDGRIAFVSDHEGVGNLYSVDPQGADLRRHTDHDDTSGYVRTPSTDGQRIVYHAMGEIFLLDSLGPVDTLDAGDAPGRPRRLDIELGTASVVDQPHPVAAAKALGAVVPDYDASASIIEVRGCAYRLTHRDGPARALSGGSEVRVREQALLGRTGNAIWVTDADGEDALEIAALEAIETPRRIAGAALGRVLHLASHPSGDTVAVISHDGQIRMVEVADGTIHGIAHAADGEPEGLAFSPDGQWLAWSQPRGERSAALVLARLADGLPTGELVRATSGRFRDFCPAFTADGRYLAFLSTRTFDPVYDVHAFEMTFPSGTRPYLLPLAADDPLPFGPSVAGWGFAPPVTSDDPKTPAVTAPSTRVDVDGMEERIAPFPVAAGRYEQLRVAGEAVLWLRHTPSGVLGTERAKLDDPTPRPALERFDFAKRSLVVLCPEIDSFEPSGDGTRVVVRDGDALLVLPADREVKEDDPDRVTVDLDRIRHQIDRRAEWRQMYDEAARLMRDHYWRPDMGGLDWDGVVARYRPLVSRLASYDDFVDLMWEVNGELGTSHAYVVPPEDPGDADRQIGHLGADLRRDSDGTWRVERILHGESSDPRARAPLRAAGVAVVAGDALVAVAGRDTPADVGPAALLAGTADRIVELTVRPVDGGPARRVAVVPLGDEEPLRYQNWVASRRSYVDEHGEGRLGYLHIPDMMAAGWAQLHRDLERATQHEGLVVDVRYNRGGHTSQLVIERLSRRVQAYQLGRHRTPDTYPEQAPRGPVVFLANQWSGSDGDIVSAMAKLLDVGPVIGVRTWGGVVGIDGRFTLVDGTSVTQPRYATWIRGPGFSVENYGVDPDIEVPMTPADHAAGRDPQLDAGIAELFRRLAETPASTPPEIPPLSG